MKTRKTKKRETLKRVAAGVLASAMFLGNCGTVLAADAETLRMEAKQAYDEADYETAAKLYAELIASGDANAADFWNAGRCEESLNFHYRAVELYDRAYELMTDNNRPEAVYEQKIRSMYNAQEYWYVEKYVLEAMQLGYEDNYMLSYYGDALLKCKQYEKAISVYQNILDNYTGDDSGSANYRRAIGNCLKNMGEPELAAQAYEEMYALDEDSETYRERMAALELEYKLNDVETIVFNYMSDNTYEEIAETLSDYDYYEEALLYYEKAESEDGADMRSSRADTYYSMGLPKEAAALYEELLTENPEDTVVMNKLGAIYCDGLGRYEEAGELFNQVVALHPDANGSKANLAVAARKSGHLEEVSDLYREVIEMDDTYLKAYNYAVMYKKDITAEEALAILSEYPGWPETEEMQALMLADTINTSYMTKATLESYLAYFRERLVEDGNHYYFLTTAGSLLRGLGQYEEALSCYEKALNQTEMLTYYATNGLGNSYYANQDYDMAAGQYEKNARIALNKDSILSVAECYIAAGQYDRARSEIEHYLDEGGLEDVSYYYMLLAYQEEDYEALLTNAEQYLKGAPDSLKGKAYKAAALTALGKEGAEEVIADIDSIRYAYEDSDVLIAESILGRFDKAREIYQFLLDYYPGDAREILHDYEIRNLLTDEKFCEMAGLETPHLESAEEKAGEETAEQVVAYENVSKAEETSAANVSVTNVIPAAVGVGGAAVLIGIAAVLVSKRKRAQ